MKSTGRILMILVGFFGLIFLFWAGSDLVIEKRHGGDIYFSENPTAFILWFIGPGLVSLGVIVLGLWGMLNNNKASAHAKHINDVEKKVLNEIALSKQALEAVEKELLKTKLPGKSTSPREIPTTTSP
jgi:type VI protein secretion system component VasK